MGHFRRAAIRLQDSGQFYDRLVVSPASEKQGYANLASTEFSEMIESPQTRAKSLEKKLKELAQLAEGKEKCECGGVSVIDTSDRQSKTWK
ncbi:hypothetical protein TNIN_144751 [Trichonephila inaurata madagascariensis]|uniref:Uncharacterized protein n=1 Tax=Trichonephila inaurata madagascariensis TaxID=2747483 RepID=A0A8X6Y4I2_9ARAC|nr:hypothetical protein TNIN_144751 [Trichonephila inaurata madagascariensis]